MVLTQLCEMGGVLAAIFLPITAMLALAVFLEQWLASCTEPQELAAVPAVRELDDLDDREAS